MQRLPCKRCHPLLVGRHGLALLLPFRGVPQTNFALPVRRCETLPCAPNTRDEPKYKSDHQDNSAFAEGTARTFRDFEFSRAPQAERFTRTACFKSSDTAQMVGCITGSRGVRGNATKHQVRLTVGRPCGAKDVVAVSSTSETGERSLHVPEPGEQGVGISKMLHKWLI